MENFNQNQRIMQKNAESHLQALLATLKYAGVNSIDIHRYEIKGKEYIENAIIGGINISQILKGLNYLYEFSGRQIQELIIENDKERRKTEDYLNHKLENLEKQGVSSTDIDDYRQKAIKKIQEYRDLGDDEYDIPIFLDHVLFDSLINKEPTEQQMEEETVTSKRR